MSVLVFSAHGLDYLWRVGGTIARYVKNGEDVHVVCLTYGERGESHSLWRKEPKLTVEEIKAIRRKESEAAAAVLGCSIEYLDWNDNPLEINKERYYQLVSIIRRVKPRIVITHTEASNTNPDHLDCATYVLHAIRYASLPGVLPEIPSCARPQVFVFEHMHPEFDNFKPRIYVDITDVIDIKRAAMQEVKTQSVLCENYTQKAAYRGWQARDIYGSAKIKYAECFEAITPTVGSTLPEQSGEYFGGVVKH